MRRIKLLSTLMMGAVVMLGGASVNGVSTILFDNQTATDITARVDYHDVVSAFCKPETKEIKAHSRTSLIREWSTSVQAYCPIGQITFTTPDGIPLARKGSSALPMWGSARIVLSLDKGALKATVYHESVR